MAAEPNDIRILVERWREDLTTRLRRAQLVFELVDTGIDLASLEQEAEQFKRVCRVLSWKGPGDD
jgi:hypothetical protein